MTRYEGRSDERDARARVDQVVRRETGHTHKHTQEQHHKRPPEEPPPPHLTTIQGGAVTVRTTSHTRMESDQAVNGKGL